MKIDLPRTVFLAMIVLAPLSLSATQAPACEPAIVGLEPSASDYARAAEILQFMTLTGGFGLDALAGSRHDVVFVTTLFLATGYSMPAPKNKWWGQEARTLSIHWSIFKDFAKAQKAMHADLRRVWWTSPRGPYVDRVLRNLERFRRWLGTDDEALDKHGRFFIALLDGKKGTVTHRPDTIGILSDAYRNQTRRVLEPLAKPEVFKIVERFLVENLLLITTNHFDLAERLSWAEGAETLQPATVLVPARTVGRTLKELIESSLRVSLEQRISTTPKLVATPANEAPASRARSSEEMALFLEHPHRIANGGVPKTRLSFLDVEFELRTVLSFVTAIQNQVSRIPSVEPSWAVLAAEFDPGGLWLEKLDRHLEEHRRLGLDRSKLLAQARFDLLNIIRWVERESAAVERASARIEREGTVDAVEGRDLQTVLHLLPRLRELAVGAAEAVEVRIERETELREVMRNVELILSRTLQRRIVRFEPDDLAEELRASLNVMAGKDAH